MTIETFAPTSVSSPSYVSKIKVNTEKPAVEWEEIIGYVVLGKQDPERDNVLFFVTGEEAGAYEGKGVVYTPVTNPNVKGEMVTLSFSQLVNGKHIGAKMHVDVQTASDFSQMVAAVMPHRLKKTGDGNTAMFKFKVIKGTSSPVREGEVIKFLWHFKPDFNSFEVLAEMPTPQEQLEEDDIRQAAQEQRKQREAAALLTQIKRAQLQKSSGSSSEPVRRESAVERLKRIVAEM